MPIKSWANSPCLTTRCTVATKDQRRWQHSAFSEALSGRLKRRILRAVDRRSESEAVETADAGTEETVAAQPIQHLQPAGVAGRSPRRFNFSIWYRKFPTTIPKTLVVPLNG